MRCHCSLLSDLCHRIYSLSSSVDLRCVKQIDAIFIGQSHQLLCHLLREWGGRNKQGGDNSGVGDHQCEVLGLFNY